MKILIWGAGALAARYIKFGYFVNGEIVGVVDTYKEEASFMGYPVYKPEDIPALSYDYLMVCVAKGCGAILQSCLAQKADLSKVFFASKEPDFGDGDRLFVERLIKLEEIRSIFPAIYEDIEESRSQKQYYNDDAVLGEMKDGSLIREISRDHVAAWIPIELLFSERQEDNYIDVSTDAWKEQNRVWENLPLVSFAPYRNLFAFFLQGKSYPDQYCAWYQNLFISKGTVSGFTDEQLIEKRFREFMGMQRELNRGMEFFIENPAIGKWNERGYFNLVDGHHRAWFLYAAGMNQIPVRVTKKDYERWAHADMASQVHELIKEQKRTEFYQPVLNPYFMNLHPYREGYVKSRLHHILEYLGPKRLAGKRVVDIGANLGYMGQAFYRMGADVTLVESDAVHYELMHKINQLLYTDCRIETQRFEACTLDGDYDIAILLTVFYHYLSNEEVREQFIQKINNHITQMIIWESGGAPEEEKAYLLEHTKFKCYKHLGYTYATGKCREMGIFMIKDSEYA